MGYIARVRKLRNKIGSQKLSCTKKADTRTKRHRLRTKSLGAQVSLLASHMRCVQIRSVRAWRCCLFRSAACMAVEIRCVQFRSVLPSATCQKLRVTSMQTLQRLRQRETACSRRPLFVLVGRDSMIHDHFPPKVPPNLGFRARYIEQT